MRRFYSLLLYLLLPYVFFHLLWRGRKQPGYRQHIGERFGFYGGEQDELCSSRERQGEASSHVLSDKPNGVSDDIPPFEKGGLGGISTAHPVSPPLPPPAPLLQRGESPDLAQDFSPTQTWANTREKETWPVAPLIWLHTVSVGETRAAAPLIHALLERYPDHRLLLTHMTPTGRETGEQLYGDKVLRCYLPYDFPWAIRRFLRHFRPAMGLLMETEIWFNLIGECRDAGVPLLLVNARLSEKSRRKFAKAPALTREALQNLTAIAAQSDGDAVRLRQLGAPDVSIMGNLKFDFSPPKKLVERGAAMRVGFGEQRPVLLAASTREGEEALLLDVLDDITAPNLLTVIVPRHPQRFDEVARLLEARGIAYQRRSESRPIRPEVRVLLGDSMGEMFAYYAACDLAYIGGSLLPLGGQNLIEATSVGTPVLIGPHTFNFTEASELAIAAGAALRVQDAKELAALTSRLFADTAARSAMKLAGLAFSQAHRGATQRLMALIAAHLDAGRR